MDFLEQLLGVEKQASGLVADADSEANRRKAAARVAAQAMAAERLKATAQDIAGAIERERERLVAERAALNAAYRGRLAARPLHRDDLERAARRFLADEP